MTKILIFGGSGFIGKHLTNKMDGIYDFLSLSRNLENDSTYSKVANILEPKSYETLLENTEIIINLVGQVEPDLEKFTASNLVGSLNLLNSAVKYNIKKTTTGPLSPTNKENKICHKNIIVRGNPIVEI